MTHDLMYKCTTCGFSYKEEKWAKQCREWCDRHHSCNMEITKHAGNDE